MMPPFFFLEALFHTADDGTLGIDVMDSESALVRSLGRQSGYGAD